VQELAGEIQGQKSAVAELKATVEKQEAIIAQQQKGIEVLTAQLQRAGATEYFNRLLKRD
jgi:hypothetical protein